MFLPGPSAVTISTWNAAKELGIHGLQRELCAGWRGRFTIMMILMCLRQYKQAFWRGYVNDFSWQDCREEICVP